MGIPRGRIVHVDLARPLEAIEPQADVGHVLLIVRHRRAVVGQVRLPGGRPLSPEDQWQAIARELGQELRGHELRGRLRELLDGGAAAPGEPRGR